MSFRTLDLNLLRVFDEVMNERSLTRAAENLALTQPAVSNALKRLRDALDDELVTRSGYGVEPTRKARAMWPAVREALASLSETLSPEPFDPVTSKKSFVLAMVDATATLLMPPLVRKMERIGHGLSARIVPLTTRDPRKVLEAGEADVAIGYFPAAVAAIGQHAVQSDSPNPFSYKRLYSGEYVAVMRKDHPLAAKPLTVDDYCAAHHLLVSYSGRPFGFIDEALAAIDRKRKVILTVNQFFTAGRVVVASDLLAVLPRHFIDSTGFMNDLAVKELPFEVPPIHADMVWHRRHENSLAQIWLRDALIDAAQEAKGTYATPLPPAPIVAEVQLPAKRTMKQAHKRATKRATVAR